MKVFVVPTKKKKNMLVKISHGMSKWKVELCELVFYSHKTKWKYLDIYKNKNIFLNINKK